MTPSMKAGEGLERSEAAAIVAKGAVSGLVTRGIQGVLAPTALALASYSFSDSELSTYAWLFTLGGMSLAIWSLQIRNLLARRADSVESVKELAVWAARSAALLTLVLLGLGVLFGTWFFFAAAVTFASLVGTISSTSRGMYLRGNNPSGLTMVEAASSVLSAIAVVLALLVFDVRSAVVLCVFIWAGNLLVSLVSLDPRRVLRSAMKATYTFRPPPLLRDGLLLCAPIVSLLVIQRSDVVLLSALGRSNEAPSYLGLIQIFDIPLVAFAGLITFLVPALAQLTEDSRRLALRTTFRTSLAVAAVLGGVASMLAAGLHGRIYNFDVMPSIATTRWLAFGSTFAILSAALSVTNVAMGNDAKGAKIALSGAAANILANICLIPYFGMSGAAFSTALTYMFQVSRYAKVLKFSVAKSIGAGFFVGMLCVSAVSILGEW